MHCVCTQAHRVQGPASWTRFSPVSFWSVGLGSKVLSPAEPSRRPSILCFSIRDYEPIIKWFYWKGLFYLSWRENERCLWSFFPWSRLHFFPLNDFFFQFLLSAWWHLTHYQTITISSIRLIVACSFLHSTQNGTYYDFLTWLMLQL